MATVFARSRHASISGLRIRVIIMTIMSGPFGGMVNSRPSLDESEPQAITKLASVSEGSGVFLSTNDAVDVSRSPEKRSSTANGASIEFDRGNTIEDGNTTPSWSSETPYASFLLENAPPTERSNSESFDEYFKSTGIDFKVSENIDSIFFQLDVGQLIPSPFYIHVNKTSANMNNYPKLIEIQEGYFVGYGENVNPDFSLDQNGDTANDEFLIEDCKMDNGFPFKLCASDGNTYDNLSHFYCVQHHDKDLQILWDGPCNRTDWPTVLWSSAEKVEVINPEEIVKFFT